MSLLFAAALSASAATLPVCAWDRPGANPFMGSVVDAVDRYSDIPAPVRAALKKRMGERQYDDIAVIRRDSVEGKFRYSPEIRDMHFGQGQVCRTVTRNQWKPAAEERGLVYCESGHCIIVPTVCRNVSRVTRLPPDRAAGAGAAGPAAAEPLSSAADELQFEAPGAGQSFAQQASPSQPTRVATGLPGILSGGESGPPTGETGPGGRGPENLAPPIMFPVRPPGPSQPPLFFPPSPTPPIPEPTTWALWLLGLAALAGVSRRRRSVIRP